MSDGNFVPSGAEIESLARAAGQAGRDWSSWCCDDVVQDYADTHGADADAWRAAYDAGLLERRRTVEGWIERWTTAPDAYDWFGTVTLSIEGQWRGRDLRRVLMHPQYAAGQIDRYASGLHGTSEQDPREIDRKIEADRAEASRREAAREAGLTWLAAATDSELNDALDADADPRGVARSDLRAELRRRAETSAEAARDAEYVRCRAIVAAHEVLVDDGTPATRSRWGNVPGRPSRVYYAVSVDDYPRDAESACVRASGKRARDQIVGSLAVVAGRLEEGDLRGADTADVPPAPVMQRIGHDRLADVSRVEVAGRIVWVGRPMFGAKELILDERGHLVRARAVLAAVASFGYPR